MGSRFKLQFLAFVINMIGMYRGFYRDSGK